MNVSKWLWLVVLSLGLCSQAAVGGSAEDAWNGLVRPPKFKRFLAFAYVKNNPELPNVLIYGDSISISYTAAAREALEGKANVYRLHCNGGDSGSFVEKMTELHNVMRDKTLDQPWSFAWDVIHFNVGLHDLKYIANGKLRVKNGEQVSSIDVYKKNLRAIVAYLKAEHPNAKLIFATTTPVPKGSAGRIAGDAVRYNAAALEVLRDTPEIAINDLYAFTLPNHAQWMASPGNVHYKPTGSTAQGKQVAASILSVL